MATVPTVATVETRIGPADNGRRMSLDEFEHIKVQPGYRYELGRGLIIVSDIPKPRLAFVEAEIRDRLTAYKIAYPDVITLIATGSNCIILLADLQSERHPDVAVYTTLPTRDDDEVWSIWIPAITIEVVSPGSELRDYIEKREEYLAFGVLEYWIIDPQQQQMRALVRHRGRWRETILAATEKYTTDLLPGFTLDLAQIFAAGEQVASSVTRRPGAGRKPGRNKPAP